MGIKNFLKHLNRRDTKLFPYFKKLALLTLLLSTTFFAGKTLAQNVYQDTNDAIEQGTNQEAWLDNGFSTTIVSISNALVGEIPDEILNGEAFMWKPSGLAGNTTSTIASLYKQPSSGIEYLAQTNSTFLGKPAYAQGIGLLGLEPLLPIWRQFRNFTYILSSVLFVVIGLLIVLRVKISPQAVIGIQNAIPNLITTLLLITFSYAISGLLIDLSYLFQSIAVGLIYPEIFNTNGFSAFMNGIFEFIATKVSLLNIFPSLGTYTNPSLAVLNGVLIIPWAVSIGLTTFTASFITSLITLPTMIFSPATGVTAAAVSGSIAFVISLIIFTIALLVWTIKFLFGVFKAYATLIFKIVLAPLEIAMGSFPGSKIGFSSWIMDIIANLLVFPISFLFIILSNKIVLSILFQGQAVEMQELFRNIFTGNWNDIGIWAPQILAGGGIAGSGLIAVGAISLSTLFLLSKLPEMIPQFVFMLKPSPWGQAVGQGMNATSLNTMAGSLAEKSKVYNSLTGRSASEDVVNTSKSLLKRFNNSNNKGKTPAPTTPFPKQTGFDPSGPRG